VIYTYQEYTRTLGVQIIEFLRPYNTTREQEDAPEYWLHKLYPIDDEV
jgi:hypothetical protein